MSNQEDELWSHIDRMIYLNKVHQSNRTVVFRISYIKVGTVMYINMDMKYRDRNEIIAQILESANGDRVRLTKIMYDVYLSHGLTKEYVRLLIEKGLMEYLDGERTFKTTDKGTNFLRIHHKVQGLTTTKSQRREILGDASRGVS
jgi:predicted transcriptional regulator